MNATIEEYKFSVFEAADYLNVTHQTVSKWARVGILANMRMPHNRRYRKADLDAFITRRINAVTDEPLETKEPEEEKYSLSTL